MTASKVEVTSAPYESKGNWYIIVRHGSVVEHVRLIDPNNAAAMLKSEFGISPARAKRMLAAVAR